MRVCRRSCSWPPKTVTEARPLLDSRASGQLLLGQAGEGGGSHGCLLVVGVSPVREDRSGTSGRKVGISSRARSTSSQPAAPRVTTETGKMPRFSRSTCRSSSSSRARTSRSKSGARTSRAAMAESGPGARPRAGPPRRPSHPGRAAPRRCPAPPGGRAGRGGGQVPQPLDDLGAVAGAQRRPDLVGVHEDDVVLLHQLGDRGHPATAAVLAHLSPPGPSRAAAACCRAGPSSRVR